MNLSNVVEMPILQITGATLSSNLFSSAIISALKGVTTLSRLEVLPEKNLYHQLSPREYQVIVEMVDYELARLDGERVSLLPFENMGDDIILYRQALHRLGAICNIKRKGYPFLVNLSFLSLVNENFEPVFGVVPHTDSEMIVTIDKHQYSPTTISYYPHLPRVIYEAYKPILKWYEGNKVVEKVVLVGMPKGKMTPKARNTYSIACNSGLFNNLYVVFEAFWNRQVIADPIVIGLYLDQKYPMAGEIPVYICQYNPTPLEKWVIDSHVV